MDTLQRINRWHNTTEGHVAFGVIEFVAAYIVGSQAVDSGSLLLWIVTIFLSVGSIQNFVLAILKRNL